VGHTVNSDIKNGRVSVVIPSFNHCRFIGQAVGSVLSQTYENIECIVIDDGSSDGSVEYLRDRYSSDPRFILSARENRGAHATINEAIASSSGEFIGILNSDDVYQPKRVETLLDVQREIAGPSFLISELEVIDDQGRPMSESGPAHYYAAMSKKVSALPDAAVFLAGNVAMTTSNFFFTRTTWETVGEFRGLRYTHDWDWALRASEIATVMRVREGLLQYRVHGRNTISESNIWKHIVENSVIFACKLLRAGLDETARIVGLDRASVTATLLRNESFLPVPVMHLLASGRSEYDLIKGVFDQSIEQELKEVHRLGESGLDIFLSVKHIVGRIQDSTQRPQQVAPPGSGGRRESIVGRLRGLMKPGFPR